MNHRSFRLLIFCMFMLAGCAGKATKPEANPALPSRIIDAHLHTIFEGDANNHLGLPMFSIAKFEEELRAARVVGGIAHVIPLNEGRRDLRRLGIIQCEGISDASRPVEVEARLRRHEVSCLKIYLGYIPRYPSDSVYAKYYRLAERYNVPVVFHTGDTFDKSAMVKFAHPMHVDEVAVRFPKVKFVIAHAGNPWVETAAELAYKDDNVYLDLSAFLTGNLDEIPAESVELLLVKPIRWAFRFVENPKKFLFGTDWPITRIEPYVRAIARAIPPEHWQAVFHDNALEVFPALKGASPEKSK